MSSTHERETWRSWLWGFVHKHHLSQGGVTLTLMCPLRSLTSILPFSKAGTAKRCCFKDIFQQEKWMKPPSRGLRLWEREMVNRRLTALFTHRNKAVCVCVFSLSCLSRARRGERSHFAWNVCVLVINIQLTKWMITGVDTHNKVGLGLTLWMTSSLNYSLSVSGIIFFNYHYYGFISFRFSLCHVLVTCSQEGSACGVCVCVFVLRQKVLPLSTPQWTLNHYSSPNCRDGTFDQRPRKKREVENVGWALELEEQRWHNKHQTPVNKEASFLTQIHRFPHSALRGQQRGGKERASGWQNAVPHTHTDTHVPSPLTFTSNEGKKAMYILQ